MVKTTRTRTPRAFGFHFMLDCYRCQPEKLDSLDACYHFLDQMVSEIGATKQTQPYVFRTPPEFKGKEGLSVRAPIVESGISIHTLTATRFVSLDVYSCREFDRARVLAFTQAFFQPEAVEQNYLLRGTAYE